MPNRIEGLHHITALARDAARTDRFFAETLGLRRVKKTVNFDAPDVYHLYYGDGAGSPGTVMTYFPFPDAAPGRRGSGEVATSVFAIPSGSADAWSARLAAADAGPELRTDAFGDRRIEFTGPDGEGLALVEAADDARAPWTRAGIGAEMGVRGFHSAVLRVTDAGPLCDLLDILGYRRVDDRGPVARFALDEATAGVIDVEAAPGAPRARQGAGSVHHVAFRVATPEHQDEIRAHLTEAGLDVTPAIDRDYFWAIYFRTPGGILFEVATDGPGFDRDEDPATLGRDLKLPARHEHLRESLTRSLPPLDRR